MPELVPPLQARQQSRDQGGACDQAAGANAGTKSVRDIIALAPWRRSGGACSGGVFGCSLSPPSWNQSSQVLCWQVLCSAARCPDDERRTARARTFCFGGRVFARHRARPIRCPCDHTRKVSVGSLAISADHTRIAPVAPYRPVWRLSSRSDPDHRKVPAGVAGEPRVALVVAGAGLARRMQVAQSEPDQRGRGAAARGLLQREGDQSCGIDRRRRWAWPRSGSAACRCHRAPPRANKAAWVAIGGKVLVRLRHLERRQVHGAQQQRGHWAAASSPGIRPRARARPGPTSMLKSEVHGRQVVGARQRVDQRSPRRADLPSVLGRRPHCPVGLAQRDRASLTGLTATSVPAAPAREVDKGLDQRTDRTRCGQRTVEAGPRVASADHRQHRAAARVGDHHRRLQAFAALAERGQALADRSLRQTLGGRREGGQDRQAARTSTLSAIVARRAARAPVRGRPDSDCAAARRRRSRPAAPSPRPRDRSALISPVSANASQHHLAARLGALGVAARIQ